jgi:hypothetical protein
MRSSSLVMGFAWGMGGLSVPLVGLVADRFGIESALAAMSLLPLVAAALAVPLPSGRRAHAPLRAPDATTAEGGGGDVADKAPLGTD